MESQFFRKVMPAAAGSKHPAMKPSRLVFIETYSFLNLPCFGLLTIYPL